MKERTTHRTLVFGALLLAMFMAAIEGTIVATAMPSIAAELGGFSLYAWVFSSFLLVQAVSIPIFGKLSDLVGRKPVFVGGVVVFLLGSVLCGFATSMGTLVAFRFLQGLGAGAVQPITVTLAGDLYSLEERGRIQGYISSVWGISSIAGPLAGGLIVHGIGWPWIFWINVPLGLAAMTLVVLYLHEEVERERRSVDWEGAFLLLVGVGSLMLALTQASTWGGAAVAGLLALSSVAMLLFVRQERRAADPLVHLELWKHPLIRNANVAGLTSGILMIGLISFLPTYVQGVLGRTPLVAGFALSMMTLGWPLAAFVVGRRIARQGILRFVRVGGVALVAGTLAIAALAPYGAVPAGIGSFAVGVGLGLVNSTTLVAIQASVSWKQRGAATASNMLMRILGNAMGAALFGGLLNLVMQGWMRRRGLDRRVSMDAVRDLIGGEGRTGSVAAGELALVRDGLAASLQVVLWGIAAVAVVTLVAAWRIPELERGEDPS